MDIPRKQKRWPGIVKWAAAVTVLVALAAFAGPRLGALYVNEGVARADFVIGRAVREDLLRDVRAAGVLVPTDLRWISAMVEGRVENVLTQPGEYVKPGTVVLELSNPTLRRNLDTARIQLDVLQAQTQVLTERRMSELLGQQAVVAEFESLYENARYRLEANRALGEVVSALDLREWTLLEGQYRERLAIERQRLHHLSTLQTAEARASEAEVLQARRQLQLQEELLEGLTVRAGLEGVLQAVPVEPGQQIGAGSLLARVAREDNFKAELRVPESQVRDVALGQRVTVAAGGQQARGQVSRIDPAVQEGIVLVDVRFDGAPLPGARPDLRVQGVIEIGFVAGALVIPRPVFSQENGSAELFVLDQEGRMADKRRVVFGMASTDRIEVLEGMVEGERAIVSDVTRYLDRESIMLVD